MVAVDLDADWPFHATCLQLGQLTIIVATGDFARGLNQLFTDRRYNSLAVGLHPTPWSRHLWPPARTLEDPELDRIFDSLARALTHED